jgi:predicted dehydrogenase
MVKVGVIGLGMMGSTHLDVYGKRRDVQVLAISDLVAEKMTGKARAAGNIEGLAKGGFDYASARHYPEGMLLIQDPEVELVDICLPTPLHVDYAIAALKAGKHVLVEKPLGLTARDAFRLAAAAAKAKTFAMCAQCIRFWPGWDWVRDAVQKQTYGKCLSAHFRRLASHPGGPFYSNGDACGGAALDLHIHDADFVQYCFGMPTAVTSRGYAKPTNRIDHIITQYHFADVPLVVAEGGWAMSAGFPFTMQFIVNFEQATAVYDLAAAEPLKLVRDGKTEAVALAPGMGYEHEIAYFLGCIEKGVAPATVTIASAAESVKLVEAEVKSVMTGKTVKVR